MENKKSTGKIKKKSTFREYAEALAIAILLALFIRTFIIQAYKIPSSSMKSTLLVGDHLFVNKFIYGIKIPFLDRFIIQFKKPERGDVVVFKFPNDESKDFIKRVIGIEGDKIEIRDDVLFVNNEKIKTKYIGKYHDEEISRADLYEETIGNNTHYILDKHTNNQYFGPITVPENRIFVMGDNRDNSEDSRVWGFVRLNKIKGKALIIYWSWPHWKRFFKVIK